MRYWPVASVIAGRTFSIRTGLDASTVTPGGPGPELSFTRPVIDACAYADAGIIASQMGTNRVFNAFMLPPYRFCRDRRVDSTSRRSPATHRSQRARAASVTAMRENTVQD